MGVKFNREYSDIIRDLGAALANIDNCFEFFDMEPADWEQLNDEEQTDYLRTLADDIFYGLGSEATIEIGEGKVQYDSTNHHIRVWTDSQIVQLVKLI
ncbi:MAG: hypothetical protein K0Q59_918 [Paenibacillus sp.]|nr:hypothetical protein [Paenibacillus sp.]